MRGSKSSTRLVSGERTARLVCAPPTQNYIIAQFRVVQCLLNIMLFNKILYLYDLCFCVSTPIEVYTHLYVVHLGYRQ